MRSKLNSITNIQHVFHFVKENFVHNFLKKRRFTQKMGLKVPKTEKNSRKKLFCERIKIKKINIIVDKTVFWCYNHHEKNIAELCKGSTADSDSVCEGSNPSSAAKSPSHKAWSFFFFHNCTNYVFII